MAKRRQEDAGEVAAGEDKYPTARQGIMRVLDTGDIPKGSIERLEITFLADGSATYRVWTPRAQEPDGGYLPVA